ncbi:hypothetical protein A6U97_26365 [Agrobacterium tumefaciens]|uniref:GHMP family kinase ATP-binding protein n=1 Tax=Agrobacterium tumefaciens TaxID=358 RepID=UPI00081013F7|nr:hypothetical protein A6U97_26365 [Agrobacterium tumefaciens]
MRSEAGVAYARLCLLGENLDWMRGQTISVGIPSMRTTVQAALRAEIVPVGQREGNFTADRIIFDDSLNEEHRIRGSKLCKAVLAAWRDQVGMLEPVSLSVKSTVFLEGGLASSASLCVGCVKAVSSLTGEHLSVLDVARMAFNAERHIAGVPCGKMDQLAVQHPSIMHFSFEGEDPTFSEIKTVEPLNFLVASTGWYEPFTTIGDRLAKENAAGNPSIESYFVQTSRLIDDIKSRARSGSLEAKSLGSALLLAQRCADELHGQKNEYFEQFIGDACSLGALGGKTSGIRISGGTMFAVFEADISGSVIDKMRKRFPAVHACQVPASS